MPRTWGALDFEMDMAIRYCSHKNVYYKMHFGILTHNNVCTHFFFWHPVDYLKSQGQLLFHFYAACSKLPPPPMNEDIEARFTAEAANTCSIIINAPNQIQIIEWFSFDIFMKHVTNGSVCSIYIMPEIHSLLTGTGRLPCFLLKIQKNMLYKHTFFFQFRLF